MARSGGEKVRQRSSQGRRLVSHDELPSWAQDNNFIVHGYRAPGGTIEALASQNRVLDQTNGHSEGAKSGVRKRKSKASLKATETLGEQSSIYEHQSFWRCWKSIWFYVHNETVNIHTHFWGAVLAIISVGLHILGANERIPAWLRPLTHHSIFYPKAINPLPPSNLKGSLLRSFISRGASSSLSAAPLVIESLLRTKGKDDYFPWHSSIRLRANDWTDWFGFASYLAGAVTVLACSATFHTVACHSREVAHSFNKLDYIGIVAMIVGSFLPMLHYGFYCHPHLQRLYVTMIVSLGALATYTVMSRKYATPKYRPIRTSVFLGLGLSAIFPTTHLLAMYGPGVVSRTMGLHYLVAGGALYVIGALLYVARTPERFSPGTFDYIGASHQIFHVFILLAAFSHYVAIRRAYTFWHTVEAISGTSGAHGSYNPATHAVCAALETLRFSQ